MKLLTKEIEKKLPPIGTTSELSADEMVAVVKFFTPDSNWTWYGIEYDPENRIMFGLVEGFATEFGDFSLAELESVKGPLGLKIERDKFFQPTKVSELLK